MGTLLLGALVMGGVLWFVVRMFRSRSASTPNQHAAATPSQGNPNAAPNFLPNRPNGPWWRLRPQGNTGGMMGGGGMGVGGMLATGAAAAAGAYLGNRMASGHDTGSHNLDNDGPASHDYDAGSAAGAGAAGAGMAGGSDYFSSRDGGAGYFSSRLFLRR